MMGDSIIIKIITIIFIIINNGKMEKNSFLLFLVFSDISLDSAKGKPKLLKLIKSVNVGRINMYIPKPFVPIILAIIILIIIPSILVINPPINKIIVDLINFSFMLNFMKKSIPL